MNSQPTPFDARCRSAAVTLLAALALLALSPAALAETPAASKVAKKPDVMAAASAPDTELLLRGCAGEAQRNAKLYVARAHGIELMKRSADRDQGRSMLRIEAQLDGTPAS